VILNSIYRWRVRLPGGDQILVSPNPASIFRVLEKKGLQEGDYILELGEFDANYVPPPQEFKTQRVRQSPKQQKLGEFE
jgi:hypothetical protein